MFDSRHLHIAIASDENYARFVASLIASVVDNNSNFDEITFHLLSNGIMADTLSRIGSVLSSERFHIETYDISDLASRLGIEVPPTIALTSYARLFMGRIIRDGISRILYLDTDIIVNGDLHNLWNTNMDKYLVGGCLDVFEGTDAKTNIGLSENAPYINAGVLMINLEKWRKDRMDEKFVDFLKMHNGSVHHHDQGIINGVCKNELLLLPPQYNMHTTVFSHPYKLIKKITNPYYDKSEFESAISSPIIIHFTEGFYNRPWKKHCLHPYRALFHHYEKMTPWSETALYPDNRSVAVRILCFSFLKLPYWCYRIVSKSLSAIRRIILH